MSDELWTKSASELAAAIARGEISSVETVEAYIARIEAVNPALNAVTAKRFDDARKEAAAADTARAGGAALPPLHGVPISVKECFDVAGMASTFGLPSRANDRAERDGLYVGRMRAAGAVVLCKTNLSQLMIFQEADNPLYGRTNNPWNLERTCGGSSGGEGALIAAGGSPLGCGADIGGSLRVPAAFNGIMSLKPTTGRLDDTVRLDIFAGQNAIVSQEGPLARTVADLDLALTIMNGGRSPGVLPPRDLADPRERDSRTLRVGYYERLPGFAPAPAAARAVREAASSLRELGLQVVQFDPPSVEVATDLFFGILSSDRARGALATLRRDPRDPRVADLLGTGSKPRAVVSLIAALLRATGQRGLERIVRNYGYDDAQHYWKLCEAQAAYRTLFAAAMDVATGGPLDVILSPPIALPAYRHGKSRGVVVSGPYTVLYNVLGYPAGTLPWTRVRADEEVGRKKSRDSVEQAAYECEVGSAGLPIGVQIVARPWRETDVLATMYALEPLARSNPDFPLTPVTPPAPK